MNTEKLERVNNLLDLVFYTLTEMEETTAVRYSKAAIELIIKEIQELKEESTNNEEK